MISLFKTSLLIILAVQLHCTDGNQRIVYVSDHELFNDNEDFITSGEDDNLICCVYGNCSCSSLDYALANLTSNVLINITTDVTLSSLVTVSDLENVTIIGHNNLTVNCRIVGGIHFTFCNNCIIQGITWDACGTENGAGLMLTDSFNITIGNCSFQHSKGPAVWLSEVSGDVNINHCNFLHNNLYRGHGAAIHYSSSNGVSSHNNLPAFTITDCNFTYNYAESLVYIEDTVTEHNDNISYITLLSASFCDNHGISVYAINYNLYLSGSILFHNNTAGKGTGIYISDHSTITFGENSKAMFAQNFAMTNGGTILVRNHSNIIFDKSSMATFSDNKAKKYGGAIFSELSSSITFKSTDKVTFNHNKARSGGAVFSYINSRVIFADVNSTASFNCNIANDLGGAIYTYDNSLISFEGNSSPVFDNNVAEYGGAVYSYHNSSIYFVGNSSPVFSNNTINGAAIYSSSHCYIFFEGNSSPVFSNNHAFFVGGAIFSESYSYIFFGENSSPVFSDNIALLGGAISSYGNAFILFKGNSTPVFKNNIAFGGGAIYSGYNSIIIFDGHSSPVFNNNIANLDGGAIHSDHNSYIGFKENTSPLFSNNVAAEVINGSILTNNYGYTILEGSYFSNSAHFGGGAICCDEDSNIVFTGNVSPVFSDNISKKEGGAMLFNHNSHISFKENSSAVFNNNTAKKYGGALCFTIDSNVAFQDDSTVVFNNNIAELGGAAFAKDNCDITFSGNSTITFTNSSATFSATVSSNKIITTGNPTVIFNGHSAKWCNSTCLPYTSTGQGVTINGNGIVWCNDPESFICLTKKCHCNKLEVLLDDLKSNTLVNITNTVTLSSVIPLRDLNNVSIIGYNNIAVICDNNTGGLDLDQCDITIEGITWIGCGYYDSFQGEPVPVLKLKYSKTVIQKCAFQYLLGIAISLHYVDSNGVLYINHCNFTNNNFYNLHGTAIYFATILLGAKVNINNCVFSYNGKAHSIIYLDYKNGNFLNLNKSRFHNNQGTSIYLSKGIVLHISGEVLFENNVAENGAGIYINENSTVIFDENSNAKFINNSVNHNGAAILLTHHSYIIFDQNSVVTFTDNKATNGIVYFEVSSNVTFKGTVTFSSNSATQYGAAIYSSDNSYVTFTGNSKVTFNSNVVSSNDIHLQHSGTIYSENNGFVSFEDDSFTVFTNNTADYGAAIYSSSNSHIVFKDNSKVTFNNNVVLYCGVVTSLLSSSIIYKDNTKVSYNANMISCTSTGNNEPSAAAMCTFQGTDVTYSGHSVVTYTNNTAGGGGAIVFSESNVITEKYSKVTFNNNIAHYSAGGAFTCYNNSNIKIKDNCNVTFNSNKASQGGGAIYSYNMCNITFNDNSTSSFINNTASNNGGAILSSQLSELNFQGNSIAIFNDNTADNGGAFHFTNSNITIKETSTVSFYNNKAVQNGGTGYLNSHCVYLLEQNVKLIFDNNKALSGGALCIDKMTEVKVQGDSTILFYNNLAIEGGGALKVLNNSRITLQNNVTVKFINNSAQYGGAVFLDTTAVMNNNSDNNCIDFTNNIAKILGNSAYQDTSELCASSNDSCFNRTMGINHEFVDTPPNRLKFIDSAICINNDSTQQCNSYFIMNVMLGKSILMPACVLDYYNRSVDSLQFIVQSETNSNYFISGPKQVVISFEKISIIGKPSLSNSTNFTITITLNTALYSDWKQLSVNLIIGLSPCHPGFWQYPNSTGCECYNASNIVFCSGSSSTIKRGYWFGSVTGKPTVTFCPINYCNFTCCETSNGYYHLSPVRVNQCTSYRSGTACGNCEEGYTLSFDSVGCINVNECSTGKTILVFVLILLYWIAIITSVFLMMHFKIGIGYLYAITYYYSVVDLLLNQNLYLSSALNTTINVLSSIAKITPQFLGRFCFIENMSGIDQQFIHFIHHYCCFTFPSNDNCVS